MSPRASFDQEVGSAVGNEDTAFFRSLFRRHTGVTPQAYRERFGRPLTC
jgi:transcriptional regulator GlxA family with amidase domain